MSFIINRWKNYERPKNPRVFKQPEIMGLVKYFIIGFVSGAIMLLLGFFVQNNLFRIHSTESYDLEGNAVLFFIYFFLWCIPTIFAAVIYNKTQTPWYGFISLIGFALSTPIFFEINPEQAIYLVYCIFSIFGANILSQGDYSIKIPHLIYNLIFGVLVCQIVVIVMEESSFTIWSYLIILQFHVFVTILVGAKMEPWAYMYMLGWALYAIYLTIAVNMLMGLYLLIAPLILTGGSLAYFYNIYLPIKRRGSV